MPVTSLRTAFLSLFIILLLSASTTAQQQVGVVWNTPSNNQQALNDLDQFSELGITKLIVNTDLEEDTWQQVDSLGFGVYSNLPVYYPTVSDFANPDSILVTKITSRLNELIARPSVTSIGAFYLGQVRSNSFKEVLEPIINQIGSVASAKLYYTSLDYSLVPADSLFDFKILQVKNPEALTGAEIPSKVQGIIYDAQSRRLAPVQSLFKKAISDSIPIFFDSDWLINMTNKHPEFKKTITHYATTGELVLPLPKEPSQKAQNHNFIVILIVLVLCAFVLNYRFNPIYKKTISRYFAAHQFLVDDIMERHIRTLSPAIIIILQHIVSAGIVMYCLGNVMITQAGWEAIQYHYPDFFITQNALMNLFIWGGVISFAIHIISILWIRFLNSAVQFISQAILLYSWPLQINFILALLIVTLMISGPFYVLIYILSALFIIIFLGAFIIACFDTSNYLSSKRVPFLLGSTGIYTLIWISLGIWIISSPYLLNVLRLAVSLH